MCEISKRSLVVIAKLDSQYYLFCSRQGMKSKLNRIHYLKPLLHILNEHLIGLLSPPKDDHHKHLEQLSFSSQTAGLASLRKRLQKDTSTNPLGYQVGISG